MAEIVVTFQSDVELQGTLALPEGQENSPAPAVLFLHGSGPLDRDENAKMGKINAFKLLSEQLSLQGFASLRYDKRGIGKSKGDYYEAGFWDLVSDAEAALKFLKTHPKIDPENVFVLGHSEGCMIAAALQKKEKASGIIFVSGPAESLKTTMIRQGEDVANDLKKAAGFQSLLFRLLNIPDKIAKQQATLFKRLDESDASVIRIKGQKLPAKWMREHFEYNVVDDLKEITCPVLAVTGSKDVQVLPEHAKLLAEGVGGKSEYYVIKNMNHMLRKQDEPANMATLKKAYKRSLKKPLDPELVEIIVTWLQKQVNRIG